MKTKQLARYIYLWQAAAKEQRWDPRDEKRRRQVTADCMAAIHREEGDERARITSITALDEAEITALFVFLAHLGNQSDPVLSARWLECQQNYRDFNLARNADHFQKQAGYATKSRICRDRFARRGSAVPKGFEGELHGKELMQRVITMNVRARRAAAKARAVAGAVARAHQPGQAHHEPHPCTDPAEPLQPHGPPDDGDDSNPFI